MIRIQFKDCLVSFTPTLYRLSPFLMSCVAVSRPCRRRYFFCCICAFLCRNFNPSLCCLSPFLLSYVTISRPCRLSELPLTGPLGNNSKGPGFSQGKRKKIGFFPRRPLAIFSPQKNRLFTGLAKDEIEKKKKKKTLQGCWLNGLVAPG